MGEKHKELNFVSKGSAGYSFSSFYECLFDAVLAFLLVTCKFSRCVVSASLDHKEEGKNEISSSTVLVGLILITLTWICDVYLKVRFIEV